MIRPLTIVVLALSLFGCAADTDAEEPADEASGAISATAPITLRNWSKHPSIATIDQLADEIAESPFKELTKEGLCDLWGEKARTKRLDPSGTVRKLSSLTSGEWGELTETFFYDDAGRLRLATRIGQGFSMQTGMTTHYEDRLYFDASGAKIWGVRRSAKDASKLARAKFQAMSETNNFESSISDHVRTSPDEAFDAPPRC